MKGEGPLNKRQQLFVENYLIDLNGAQAAIRAGYSKAAAKEMASRLLTYANVKKAVDEAMEERMEKVKITAEEVLDDLLELKDMCMARKNVSRTIMIKSGESEPPVPVEIEGKVFEPNAARGALDLVGKHLGMWKDKLEVTGDLEMRLSERIQKAREIDNQD